jgi:organic radical activating enzyme
MTNTTKKYHTTSICSTCYRELEAQIEYRQDGAAYITKTCPVHGYEEAMVERSAEFWDTATQTDPNNLKYHVYNDVTMIEVTDRCNVQCKHCYHDPDNTVPDQSLEWIVAKARAANTGYICLIGAEPTMRSDLPDLIRAIRALPWRGTDHKRVLVYTNGVKLQNADYVRELADSGLDTISVSVHHPEYHEANVWKHVSRAMTNIADTNITLGQISFTVENKTQMNHAVDKMLWLMERGRNPNDFCVRSPAEIGVPFEQQQEIFASDLYQWMSEVAAERGLTFGKHPNNGSNPYHVGCLLNGQTIQLIHWASAQSVDTTYMNVGPWATFVPNTRGTFLIQAILRDGWKKGWWQGQQISKSKTVQWV